MAEAELRVGGRSITVTNSDRVVFPDDGVTKGEIVEHYRRVASVMLPHVRGRPVMLQRTVDIRRPAIYQKAIPSHFPAWIDRVTVPKVGGTVTHVVCDDAASLVYIANQGSLTPHVWLSRMDHVDRPDRMIIDLDPGSGGTDDARFAAHAARRLLTDAGLVPFLMATGSRGYHIVAPLRPAATFDEVRTVVDGLAEAARPRGARSAHHGVLQGEAAGAAVPRLRAQRVGADRRAAIRDPPATGRARRRPAGVGRARHDRARRVDGPDDRRPVEADARPVGRDRAPCPFARRDAPLARAPRGSGELAGSFTQRPGSAATHPEPRTASRSSGSCATRESAGGTIVP
jgi:DNA ligase D-like protein (predicted polymerase)